MSWTGFRKAMSRAGTQVMMKTGHIDRTIDREYETEERRYHVLEQLVTKLRGEAKAYLDTLRAVTSAQMKIAETIDILYGESGTRDNVSKYYLQAVEGLDTKTIKELDEPYREAVLDPVTRFCAYFNDIEEAIKKRHHKLLDYDKLRHKTTKLVDKPSDDVTKLPQAEQELKQAKEAYEQINEQLTAELPQLIDFRVPYLDPSFEALVKIQLRIFEESYTRLAEVQQYLEPQVRDEYASGQLDNYVEQALGQMRQLSIVSD